MPDLTVAPLVVGPPPRRQRSWYVSVARPIYWVATPGGARLSHRAWWRLHTGSIVIGGVLGALLALLARGGEPLVAGSLIVAAVVASVAWSVADRWTWPWQLHVLRSARESNRVAHILLGPMLSDAAAERWLAQTGGASTRDQMAVLSYLGRDDDVDRLIALLPTDTPDARFRQALFEVLADWRASGIAGARAAARRLSELNTPDGGRETASLIFWRATAAVAAGEDIRRQPAPSGPPPSISEHAAMWWRRLWPVHWLVGAFAGTLIVLECLELILAR